MAPPLPRTTAPPLQNFGQALGYLLSPYEITCKLATAGQVNAPRSPRADLRAVGGCPATQPAPPVGQSLGAAVSALSPRLSTGASACC